MSPQYCPREATPFAAANRRSMQSGRLTRHATASGPRWAFDGRYLPTGVNLSLLLSLPAEGMRAILGDLAGDVEAHDPLLAPIDPIQEVWASGVTYVRSREARKLESKTADIYSRVYDAERPEIFFKSIGWRVVGSGANVRIRKDANWNVPEPEMVLVINCFSEIVGYAAGNDMSSRDIEGENPLYLPQAKVYDGSCAIGPGILLTGTGDLGDVAIAMRVSRNENDVFVGSTSTAQMKRSFDELVRCLQAEYAIPSGALLMTGTGLVPPDDFSLSIGDQVDISVGTLALKNTVSG